MGCGDVRLLRTIRSVDFTGQERAALNKLTVSMIPLPIGVALRQRWVPVGDGLTHKLTDLQSWLLNCRSAPAGESYGSQLTGWAVTQ